MKIKILFFLLLICTGLNAQSFQSAKTGGGSSTDAGYAICTDSQGNVYTGGTFRNTAQFDGVSVTSRGHVDIFIAKYNSSGTLLWIKTAGSSYADELTRLRMSEDGFIYGYGNFSGKMILGLDTITASDFEPEDIFLFKMNTSGEFLWAKNYGGGSQNWPNDMQIKDNNIIMTGYYIGGTFVAGSTTLQSFPSVFAGFVLKTDANGVPQWSKNTGGQTYVAMADDAFYMATSLGGTRTFDELTLTSNGPTDALLTSYDYNGNRNWYKQYGGTGNEHMRSLCYNRATNSIYWGGCFYETMNVEGNTLVSNGQSDIFIARFDTQGNNIWAKSYGGTGLDYTNASTVDAEGNFYIGGYFNNSVNFGQVTINSAGASDSYAAKFNSNGNFQWVRNGGGSDMDNVFGMALGNNSDLYFLGFFQGSSSYGSLQIMSSGTTDYYQIKISAITSIHSPRETVNSYRLEQNYPNPFNPSTKISFNIPKAGGVKLKVMDITGKEVAELVNASMIAGSYEVNFNAENLSGGIYFYSLETANGVETKKMILVK